MITSDGNTDGDTLDLEVRNCSDEDFENNFYPPSKTSVDKFASLKAASTLKCINPLDSDGNPIDLRIWGKSEVEPHRRLDLSFMPCTPQSDDRRGDCYVNAHTDANYR